ncbi:MAG: methyl-accepting chemotaxis protein [Nitrospirota bacterium]
MSIKNRIILSSVILLILFLAMGGINWFGNKAVMDKNELAYLLKNGTMHLQGVFRGINEFIIDEGEPLSIKLTRGHISGYEEMHGMFAVVLKDPEMRKVYKEQIDPQWKKVREGAEDFLKIKRIRVTNDDAMLQYGQLTAEAKILLKDVEALADKSQAEAKSMAKKIKIIVNVVAVVIMVIMCFVLVSLYRSIAAPIKKLNTIAEGFEKGDLSITMDEARKDEFGKLAVNFNQALIKLSAFIGRLKDDINSVVASAQKFSDDSSRIATDAQSQSSQTGQAAAATEELSATFNDIVQNTEVVTNSANDAFNQAMESGDVVIQAMNSMNTIAEAVKEAAVIIEGLSHRSSQIGEIVEVINEIADQTNLLALNAAIESARAGEHGRGFAVVANEVKKLAERTTAATKEIADMIKGIQQDTGKAVESMQLCTNEVSSGTGFSEKAGNSLQMIVMSSQNVTDMIRRIAAAVEEQSSAAGEITNSLSEIANITYQTSESALQSSESSRRLSEMALELKSLAGEFRLGNGVDKDTIC